jgi:hypothetical protein
VKPAVERMREHRARMYADGYRQYVFWLKPAMVEKVKRFIERLKRS